MRRSRRTVALAAALAALTTLAVATAPGAMAKPPKENIPAIAPFDYIAQADSLSQPVYPKTIKDVARIPAEDGKLLYVEIVRPDPAEYPGLAPVPVILEASPYHGTIATRIGDRIFPDPRGPGNQMLGLTGYFAPRGYAVAMMDLRGTGRSQGCLDHLGPKDASDMTIVIEWLASRDWSNGRVGMAGHSYVGASQNVAAAQRPEGLVTIVPSAGLASMYDHQFNKGVPWYFQWIGPMIAYEALALVRDLPPGFTEPILTGAPTGDNWTGTPNTETGCGMQNSSLTAGSGQVTGQYEGWHALRDWSEEAANADIPIFMVHGVNDNAARIPAAEWFFANRFLRKRDKVWIGQWDHGSTNGRCGATNNVRINHPNCRMDQWQYALHAWFDRHLLQNGADTGPQVEVFLNGVNTQDITPPRNPSNWGTKIFAAKAWKQYPTVELYPDATDMSLGFEQPAESGTGTYMGVDVTHPVNLASKAHVGANLTFMSEPFAEDTLFLGLPQLLLRASVTNSQSAHLTATLSRVGPNGFREPMNFCGINPLLRNGVEQVAPVVPGQVMDLPMQCFTMAHWVPAGQRVVLELSTTSRHHASEGAEGQITVHTGPDQTVYELPEVRGFKTLFDDVPLRR
jgi:putative CocE/NonD family hydrolase